MNENKRQTRNNDVLNESYVNLGPNRNNNWCMDANVTASGFLVLLKHLVHHTEKL